MHGLEYEFWTIEKGSSRYNLVPYTEARDAEAIRRIQQLLKVYQGKMNRIGIAKGKRQPFSKGWLEASPSMYRFIKSNLKSFFRHVAGNRIDDFLYTTYEGFESKVATRRFWKTFITLPTRATNKYRDKKAVAYLANLFVHPNILEYFRTKNVWVDPELYALSEMLQLVWRTQIRDHKPINLYLPSDRMRQILQMWFDSAETLPESMPFENRKAA